MIQIIFTSGATAEPKGVVIRHRNVLANIVPVEREVAKYRRYARPFQPLRFVNLLPLSHMFGQSMATNIPPMVRGTVIFTRSFNPHDIAAADQVAARVGAGVRAEDPRRAARARRPRHARSPPKPPPPGISIPGRWWRYRRVHSAFGLKFWAFVVGAAPLPPDLEEFWRRMGFAVIQGYGLTETAPIVTLNHPFKTSKGSVGTPIAGVEVRIAEDGEILVRGENVTSGYYDGPSPEARRPSPADRRRRLAAHRRHRRARRAGAPVHQGTQEGNDRHAGGLNVFPEDVERVLDELPGVRESAVVGVTRAREERVHAVLVLEPGADRDAVVRDANARLQDHQRIRARVGLAGGGAAAHRGHAQAQTRARSATGSRPAAQPLAATGGDTLEALIARFARGRDVSGATTLEELGLSSLERVELMVALEDRSRRASTKARFSEAAQRRRAQAARRAAAPPPTTVERAGRLPVVEPHAGPCGSSGGCRWRRGSCRWRALFAHVRVEGLRASRRHSTGPVIFASNHQSHMDVPVILAALPGRWRARVAPAMAKEFFKAHFFPAGPHVAAVVHELAELLPGGFYFNAFPLPQREAGARQTLQYIGELTGEGLVDPDLSRRACGRRPATSSRSAAASA